MYKDTTGKRTMLWLLAGGLGLTLALAREAPTFADRDHDHDDHHEALHNAVNFHLVDFIGWNNRDWNVMRHLHTADVKVDIAGQHTDGIEPHIAVLKQFINGDPQSRIVQHTPIVAEGDWTCMVGVTNSGGQLATVAKWRDAAIAEEYLFLAPQPDRTPRPALAGKPLVQISNPDQAHALFDIAGAEPGWSCVVDRAKDGRRVAIFTRRDGGAVVKETIFNEY